MAHLLISKGNAVTTSQLGKVSLFSLLDSELDLQVLRWGWGWISGWWNLFSGSDVALATTWTSAY